MQRSLAVDQEFADHREYYPGDRDFRYLDWNVFARHNELLLKRFQEEEDSASSISLLDCSRSMSYGDPGEVRLCLGRSPRRSDISRWRTWTAWKGGRLCRRHRGRSAR